jgi:hypothetical protein
MSFSNPCACVCARLCAVLLFKRKVWVYLDTASNQALFEAWCVSWTLCVGRSVWGTPALCVVCPDAFSQEWIRTHAVLFPWITWCVSEEAFPSSKDVKLPQGVFRKGSVLGCYVQLLCRAVFKLFQINRLSNRSQVVPI